MRKLGKIMDVAYKQRQETDLHGAEFNKLKKGMKSFQHEKEKMFEDFLMKDVLIH